MRPFPAALVARLRALAVGAAPEDPVAWARDQRVGPILDRLDREGPWGTADERQRRHAAALVRWTFVLDHLTETLAALRAASVPCLVLKGAALALMRYPSPVFRPMDDVDVLVSPEDYTRAREALARGGFGYVSHADHETTYRSRDGRGTVELHRALASSGALFAFPFGALWERRQPMGPEVDGATLGEADMLVHLSIHAAFQHGFALRLNQYLDFAQLVEPGVPADEVARRAQAAGAIESVAASARVAELLWGVPLAPELADHVPPPIRRWVDELAPRPWDAMAGLPLARARWYLSPGLRRKAALLRATLAPEPAMSAWTIVRRLGALARAHGLAPLRRRTKPTVRSTTPA
jgi:Uncharacterised nucleotidyltransferase